MPVSSFSLADLIPNLISGLITFIPDTYQETFGLSGMANEARPQMEPKIRVMGKVYKRFVAGDIPEASEATLIKDNKFTDEMFTAPEYGKGFAITTNDLIKNQDYQVNFKTMTVARDQAPRLVERAKNASVECINMIKRSADMQVKQMLETGTLQFDNYETIDFGRDSGNSATITSSTLKWTIANYDTMKPLDNINTWTKQVATRGNSGGAEFIVLMESSTYTAFANSSQFKDDSNQRRNFKIMQIAGVNANMNKNIPAGALYRYTIVDNEAGPAHIFTYDQTYDYSASVQKTWLDAGKVYIIATDNVIQRQPVEILTFDDLIAQSTNIRQLLAQMPQMRGWLITPEWNKTTNRALVMGIYRKFLTQMLTPNKTFCAIVNS